MIVYPLATSPYTRPPPVSPVFSVSSCALCGRIDSVADIGSGAGFPGLPLKLWTPHIALTLIESNHKKAGIPDSRPSPPADSGAGCMLPLSRIACQ